jgi:hypothetical protein
MRRVQMKMKEAAITILVVMAGVLAATWFNKKVTKI